MKNTKAIGDAGEDLAADFLAENGYQIVGRNFRTKFGEIDIIAKEDGVLVFAEVKKKSSARFGFPYEMVTTKKIEKIKRTAEAYISENSYKGEWRIDVVSIFGEKVELFKNITT
jgi:putative endonuclease